MGRVLAFVPILALATLMAVAAFVLMLDRGDAPQIVSTGTPLRMAPRYALERLGGGAALGNADHAGQAYLINVFGSWCTPCRAEHPLLMELKQRGVIIVGVDYKDAPQNGAAFLERFGNPFAEVGLDPEGRFGLDLGISGVPETFVIGPDGRIRAVHREPLTPEVIEREILPALEAP